MLVKFDVRDGQNKVLGTTSVNFDWRSHIWAVSDDKSGVWKRVAASRSGGFEAKDWGVMWMMDKSRNIAIVHDSPKSGTDTSATHGTARLYDPVDSSLKDAHALWNIELSASAKFQLVTFKPLPFSRQAYIERLNMLFPAPYLSINNDLLTSKLRKDDPKVKSKPGYTTCGSLPGFVSGQVALSKGLKGKKFQDWMNANSLNGTNRVRDIGIKLGCWVESSKDKKPKPGDIFALLDRGLSNKATDGIAHVGVFECEVGNSWRTFDLGQAGGFDGAKNTRDYKAASCELWGETNQGGGYRVVAGWVNLERYFGA
ncbi:MAG: hypothetical protein AB7V18_11745 [Pyrinomonadaceae bacterium]